MQFFQRAVAIGPHFVQAYQEVGKTYYNLSEPLLAAENLKKAFDRRWAACGGGPVCYIVLARAYKDANRFAEAKAVGAEAIRRGKDTTALHWILYEVAFDEQDAAALAHEDELLASEADTSQYMRSFQVFGHLNRGAT